MHQLLILTFIIVVIVVITCRNLVECALLISILVNFALLATRCDFSAIAGLCSGASANAGANAFSLAHGNTGADLFSNPNENTSSQPPNITQDENANAYSPDTDPVARTPYGPYYEDWDRYRQYVNGQASGFNSRLLGGRSIDDQACDVIRAQARDKRALDGWATKDANYYRYHFAGELQEYEDKPWWGRHEYLSNESKWK